jgi:arylsulfatase
MHRASLANDGSYRKRRIEWAAAAAAQERRGALWNFPWAPTPWLARGFEISIVGTIAQIDDLEVHGGIRHVSAAQMKRDDSLGYKRWPCARRTSERRRVVQVVRLSLVAFLALAWGPLHVSTAKAADPRPNILLVVADDMGWTDIGSFGGEIETPNLDKLADRGVRFTDFHVSVSCSPTLSMLLSGTDNHVAGLGNMGELITPEQRGKPGYEGHLNDRVVSLAEVLRSGGYHTYMAGKWHLGHEPEHFPRARGFERSFALLNGGASHWNDMSGLMEVETPAQYTRDGKRLDELPKDHFSSRSFTDFLIDAIRENRGAGRPFLAYLAFQAPHDPMQVPEPWLSKYRGRYDDGYEALKGQRAAAARQLKLVSEKAEVPGAHPMQRAWSSLSAEEKAIEGRGMEVYAGMVDNMDYHFGRVVKLLQDIGEYENTVILFFSDNGANPWTSEDYPGNRGSEWFAAFDNSIENIGHPGSNYAYGMGWAVAGAGPLDRFKMTVSEGGIRSPLLIAGPGVKGGRTVTAFSYVTDIMPTILEVAGIKHPEEFRGRKVEPLRGRSLTGVLSGASAEVYGADEAIGGEMGNGKWMRRGDYKAVFVPKPYGTAAWHLYNVVEDPGETRDLAGDMPEVLEGLQAAWDRWAEDVGVVLSHH